MHYSHGTLTRFLMYLIFISLVLKNNAESTPHNQTSDFKEQNSEPDTTDTWDSLVKALDVLQSNYFENWPGVWPTAIDWTSAVTGTLIFGALTTFSTSQPKSISTTAVENLINRRFSQLTASFFGQNTLALRMQANDDMLWTVLEWLEGIKFIDEHSSHYSSEIVGDSWYAQQWIPTFAHRARIFWDQASQGWDTTLCDGGMTWNPRLTPYKNAITNELYISASVGMYLYFPGDNDVSPFSVSESNVSVSDLPNKTRDPKFLAAAQDAYHWLVNSNMTDSNGLFVDGFHISGWKSNQTVNKRCDDRNEMVYTYNQGVLLSGLSGLYQATGDRSYLDDGHKLVRNVIAATGWDLENSKPREDAPENIDEPGSRIWYGLGQLGILEEACDFSSACSQDGQTFKGIFFHHLTIFCSPLQNPLQVPEEDSHESPDKISQWHSENCDNYGSWIKLNAMAALGTVNAKGKFGAWWGASANTTLSSTANAVPLPAMAIDYQNNGIPTEWNLDQPDKNRPKKEVDTLRHPSNSESSDLNDRGRGRTIETQTGGLSVLRASWELVDYPGILASRVAKRSNHAKLHIRRTSHSQRDPLCPISSRKFHALRHF
ncbi:Bgt-1305 [Blumeria graminis f. sp. tritici]|uniref:Bgt-1305 n=3 Tax=Blumeria graminis TaxID=34373 RepID=A0A381LFZ5_BLUGR|nr:hypothetical protein BGT96224_1305 [Blumeria graminis f. sp. tritici 96224]VDB93256.1 Bgt-1305 [Blumeria graminis f. sp. tritici]